MVKKTWRWRSWKDKPSATRVGTLLTIGYLLISAMMAYRFHTKEMDLNEWGDFLAGVFAPLAFLWLILGYRQQGEELKQNTEALRLQVQELNQSVKQQEALVKVTQEQLVLENKKREDEILLKNINMQKEIDNARPDIQLSQPIEYSIRDSVFVYYFRMNSKKTAKNICAVSDFEPERFEALNYDRLNSDEPMGTQISFPHQSMPPIIHLKFLYTDIYENPYEKSFKLVKDSTTEKHKYYVHEQSVKLRET